MLGWLIAASLHAGALVRPAEAGTIRTPGIDVSHYQGTINWPSVKKAGIQFAFVKASEGLNTGDAYFTSNMSAAKAAGVVAGAYHFAYPQLAGHTAAAEAQHFLSVAKPYITNGYLIPVLDLEQGGGQAAVGATSLSAWANQWCADVYAATKVDPIIYLNTDYARNYVNSSVTPHKDWIANYNSVNPDSGSSVNGVWGTKWTVFQYSSTGTVSGISGNVDTDYFNGPASALSTITIPEPAVGLALLPAIGLLRRRRGGRDCGGVAG
jgi:GH25 family lysozyme M1 (1,4-beta-N-acetylmuramidase)